jgi:hypothetical protein
MAGRQLRYLTSTASSMRGQGAFRFRGSRRWSVAGRLAELGGGSRGVAKVAAVAVRTAGRGHEHLAEEGLVARVADHGAQLLHAVRKATAPGVRARAALPLVAQLCLQGALPVRFYLHLPVLRFLLPSLLPFANYNIKIKYGIG